MTGGSPKNSNAQFAGFGKKMIPLQTSCTPADVEKAVRQARGRILLFVEAFAVFVAETDILRQRIIEILLCKNVSIRCERAIQNFTLVDEFYGPKTYANKLEVNS